MKKLYIIPALVALLAVGCDSSSGGSSKKSSWGKELESEMKQYIGEVLPYVSFNKDSFEHGWDELYECYYMQDDNSKSIFDGYGDKLAKAGWTSVTEGTYTKTNKFGDLTLMYGFEEATTEFAAGNVLMVYVEGGDVPPGGDWGPGDGTNWEAGMAEEMAYYIGEVLPYVQFHSTAFEAGWDDYYGCYYIDDDSSETIFNGYEAKLTAAGWTKGKDAWEDVCYTKENEVGELTLYFDYYANPDQGNPGNEILVYVDAGGGTIEGDTIVFGDLDLEDGVQYDYFEAENFCIYFEGGENDGKYYDAGEAVRTYGDGSIVIEAYEGTITEVQFEFVQASSKTDFPSSSSVFSTGTYNPNTMVWTGSASTLVATRPSGKGHWALAGLSVVVE